MTLQQEKKCIQHSTRRFALAYLDKESFSFSVLKQVNCCVHAQVWRDNTLATIHTGVKAASCFADWKKQRDSLRHSCYARIIRKAPFLDAERTVAVLILEYGGTPLFAQSDAECISDLWNFAEMSPDDYAKKATPFQQTKLAHAHM